jgi:hypothetical protein
VIDGRATGIAESVQAAHARRLEQWGQTPATRLQDAAGAAAFLSRVGVASLFPAAPEIPNLYHAHTGDPSSRPEAKWDSPAGRVYGWRWALGRPAVACYTTLVQRRPTWITWELLPAVLRLRDAVRPPAVVRTSGELSAGAARIVQVLLDCDGVLSTGVLRALAGFPTGKAERAAFLRAVAELDDRLVLAKVFADDDEDMRHALVHVRYPEHVAAAASLSRPAALEAILTTYLPQAIYARPAHLARALSVPEAEVREALERLARAGQAVPGDLPSGNPALYYWAPTVR